MDEKDLISSARKGDLNAFNQLVLLYQSRVYNLAYRILGDTDAAEDVTQEAFISAYGSIRGFKGGSFKAWILRIVTNACYDEIRRRKRRPTTSLEALFISDYADYQEESPEEEALRSELNSLLQEGIETLPPDQRITLVLSDVEGMSYKEIAEVTKVSIGTVKSRLSRGRARLRDFLLKNRELLPEHYRHKIGRSDDVRVSKEEIKTRAS
jgi:RNA polymerase sigma-70 factor (ECF subfamily)